MKDKKHKCQTQDIRVALITTQNDKKTDVVSDQVINEIKPLDLGKADR
jgi:predicted nucleic acid-binding protein